MGISQADYLAMEARLNKGKVVDKRTSKAVAREADLHDDISDYCKGKGYLVRHDRMDKPTTGQVGWPDFEIHKPKAITVFLEAKAAGRKATWEQLGMIARLRKLGYTAEIVDNIQDSIKVIEER
jgi:hypothetical protein